MATVEEVRTAIAQAVGKANDSINALQQAADLAEDAQALLSQTTQGSGQSEVEQANAHFAQVASGVGDLQNQLRAGINQAESYNSGL